MKAKPNSKQQHVTSVGRLSLTGFALILAGCLGPQTSGPHLATPASSAPSRQTMQTAGDSSRQTHRVFGVDFIVGMTDTPTGPQHYLTAVGSNDRAVGPGRYFKVANSFDPKWVTKGLSSAYSDAALTPGSLFAGINPDRDPVTDGVDLSFVTTGSVVWHGNRFSAGPGDQLVFVNSLRWNKAEGPWRMSFGAGTKLVGLGLIECEGFLSAVATGTLQLDERTGKFQTAPGQASFTPRCVLNVTKPQRPAYCISLEPETFTKLLPGASGSLEYGQDHHYRVRGFVDKKAQKVFVPPYVEVLIVTAIEQLR